MVVELIVVVAVVGYCKLVIVLVVVTVFVSVAFVIVVGVCSRNT